MALNTNLRTEPGKRIILDRASGNQGAAPPTAGGRQFGSSTLEHQTFRTSLANGLAPLAEFEFGGAGLGGLGLDEAGVDVFHRGGVEWRRFWGCSPSELQACSVRIARRATRLVVGLGFLRDSLVEKKNNSPNKQSINEPNIVPSMINPIASEMSALSETIRESSIIERYICLLFGHGSQMQHALTYVSSKAVEPNSLRAFSWVIEAPLRVIQAD
ncbi:hypothetical protein B0H13DRAFT_1884407 [Mycena leptocephala]|nr:hypothetical protein B0H13DRAFT_1884407 [Mycena leptocephala]